MSTLILGKACLPGGTTPDEEEDGSRKIGTGRGDFDCGLENINNDACTRMRALSAFAEPRNELSQDHQEDEGAGADAGGAGVNTRDPGRELTGRTRPLKWRVPFRLCSLGQCSR